MGVSAASRCCECSHSERRAAPVTIESVRAATSTRSECGSLLTTCASTAAASSVASPWRSAKRISRSGCTEGQGSPGHSAFDAIPDVELQEKLQVFAESLIEGLEMQMLVEGVGEVPATASLDKDMSTLTLKVNSSRKDLLLKTVRQIGTCRAESVPKSAAKQEASGSPHVPDIFCWAFDCSPRHRGHGSKSLWVSQLKLADGRVCCFSFEGSEQGFVEADEFCDCVRALVEVARFEQAKLDLKELARHGPAREVLDTPPEFSSRDPSRAAPCVAAQSAAPATEHRGAASPRRGLGVLADERNRQLLISRLLAAGAVMDESELR